MKATRLSRFLLLLVLTVLTVAPLAARPAAASTDTTASSPRTWFATVGVQSGDLAVQGMAFLPGSLWINVGDTVVWTVRAGDIHTVTFLKPGQVRPPFNPSDPLQTMRQGSTHYNGVSYYNSGLMSNFPGLTPFRRYALTFDVAGDFAYICLVHPSMLGVIHVRPAGTHYPFTQEQYEQMVMTQAASILRDGHVLADLATDTSTNTSVAAGIGDGLASVMRFFPQFISIHVGDTVTFTNRDVMEPHTVTFGPPQRNDFVPYGNPTHFDGTQPLNSGFLGQNPAWFGTTFKVTFVKAGTYAFRCDLHDFLGMVAVVIVS